MEEPARPPSFPFSEMYLRVLGQMVSGSLREKNQTKTKPKQNQNQNKTCKTS